MSLNDHDWTKTQRPNLAQTPAMSPDLIFTQGLRSATNISTFVLPSERFLTQNSNGKLWRYSRGFPGTQPDNLTTCIK